MSDRHGDWRTEAEWLLHAPVPYATVHRVRRRLQERALAHEAGPRGRWVWLLAGAMAMTALTFMGGRTAPSTPAVASAFTIDVATCQHRGTAETGISLEGGCRLHAPGLVVVSEGSTQIEGDPGRITLVHGRLDVSVDPAFPRAAPFVLATGAVEIVVTGTRFVVAHDRTGGVLEVVEGSVHVTHRSGGAWRVAAGQRLRWHGQAAAWAIVPPDTSPLATVDEPMPAAGRSTARPQARSVESGRDEPATTSTGRSAARTQARSLPVTKPTTHEGARPRSARTEARLDSDRLVREVEALRTQGHAHTAVARIRRALARELPWRDREVLAFELGKLIERAEGPHAACRYWLAYTREFPGTRYRELVHAELARLACASAPDPG